MRRLALALFIIALLLLATAIWRTDDAHENAPTPALTPVRDSIKFKLKVEVRMDSTARAEQARLDSLFMLYRRERLRAWSLRRSFARAA